MRCMRQNYRTGIYNRLSRIDNAIDVLKRLNDEYPKLSPDNYYYMNVHVDMSTSHVEISKEVLLAALLIEKQCLEEELKERLNNEKR